MTDLEKIQDQLEKAMSELKELNQEETQLAYDYIEYANILVKNLILHGVVVNEAEKEFKPCGEGDNICNCKNASECGYTSEVELCQCKQPKMLSINEIDTEHCKNCKKPLWHN